MSHKVAISGAVFTSLLNEVDHTDFPSFGILFGSYQARTRQIMSDSNENENITENVLGISSFFGTKRSFPFFSKGQINISNSIKKEYEISDREFESIVGLYVIRRSSSSLSPSLRDVETLMELSLEKKCRHPMILLMISLPAITDTPTWIYSMEYTCFSLPEAADTWIHHTPNLEQIDLYIPSLSADIGVEYRSVENLIPSMKRHDHISSHDRTLQLHSKNVLCDTILATINTELMAAQYMTEIQNELIKVEELENEIKQLKLICK